MGERSLARLIEAAASCCQGDVADRVQQIVRLASVGLFDQALRLTHLSSLRLEFLAELSGTTVVNLREMRDRGTDEWERFREYHWAIAFAIEQEPCWQALSAACELADRVDIFLARHGCGEEGGQLARSCRDDTALLGVLADWLEERQELQAAEEARHLRVLCEGVAFDLPSQTEIIYSHYFFDMEQE